MNTLNKYLATAFNLLADKNCKLSNGSGSIPSVYKGYIAAMASAMNQSGLLPTLAYYSGVPTDASRMEGEPVLLLDLILQVLQTHHPETLTAASLKDLALQHHADLPALRRLQNRIVTASVALKLAMRTYHLTKS